MVKELEKIKTDKNEQIEWRGMNINKCTVSRLGMKEERKERTEIKSDPMWAEAIHSHKYRCNKNFLILSRKKGRSCQAYCDTCGHVLFQWGL